MNTQKNGNSIVSRLHTCVVSCPALENEASLSFSVDNCSRSCANVSFCSETTSLSDKFSAIIAPNSSSSAMLYGLNVLETLLTWFWRDVVGTTVLPGSDPESFLPKFNHTDMACDSFDIIQNSRFLNVGKSLHQGYKPWYRVFDTLIDLLSNRAPSQML